MNLIQQVHNYFKFKKSDTSNLVLYKYRSWNYDIDPDGYQRRVLTHNELFLSSADQFNDPFDSSLPFQYKKRDLRPKKIYKKMYKMAR